MKITFDWPDSVPQDQIDEPFIQGMLDRMAVGFHNYGHIRRYENVSNSLKNVIIRLAKYAGMNNIQEIVKELSVRIDLPPTGNTEFLMDASNYCMMEFVKPSLDFAYFATTTKEDSPGAIVGGKHVKGKEDYDSTKLQQKFQKEGD